MIEVQIRYSEREPGAIASAIHAGWRALGALVTFFGFSNRERGGN